MHGKDEANSFCDRTELQLSLYRNCIYLVRFLKTSLKTTLVVEVNFFVLSLSCIKTFSLFFDLTLDNATYNWSWLNTGFGK